MEPETRNFSSLILDALRTRSITVERLAQITGISERFLSLLVDEQFEKLPAAPYVRGYVIKVADVLGLDGEKLWQQYLKDNNTVHRSGKHDTLPANRFITPHINKTLILSGIIGVLVIVYVIIRLPALRGTPEIKLEGIEDTMIVSDSAFVIRGTMNPTDELTINDELVYSDENGSFEKQFVLDSGFNTFTIKAKKFLGKEIEITKQVFYDVPASSLPTSTGSR